MQVGKNMKLNRYTLTLLYPNEVKTEIVEAHRIQYSDKRIEFLINVENLKKEDVSNQDIRNYMRLMNFNHENHSLSENTILIKSYPIDIVIIEKIEELYVDYKIAKIKTTCKTEKI